MKIAYQNALYFLSSSYLWGQYMKINLYLPLILNAVFAEIILFPKSSKLFDLFIWRLINWPANSDDFFSIWLYLFLEPIINHQLQSKFNWIYSKPSYEVLTWLFNANDLSFRLFCCKAFRPWKLNSVLLAFFKVVDFQFWCPKQ